jgi:hypothetical protein
MRTQTCVRFHFVHDYDRSLVASVRWTCFYPQPHQPSRLRLKRPQTHITFTPERDRLPVASARVHRTCHHFQPCHECSHSLINAMPIQTHLDRAIIRPPIMSPSPSHRLHPQSPLPFMGTHDHKHASMYLHSLVTGHVYEAAYQTSVYMRAQLFAR